MANQEYVDLIKQDIDAWNAWRNEHWDIRPDFSEADLSGADLSNAILSEAILSRADLSETNLAGAHLYRADLEQAKLRQADLLGADLAGADLEQADLSRANLSSAFLVGANLAGADLEEADLAGAHLFEVNFTQVRLGYTIFAWVNLCHVNGLETVVHNGPSSVDINSVTLPRGDTRVHFLRGVGFPDTFIDYLPSLLTMPLQYHSLFLSYAHPDEVLARRLYQDLQNRGVRCWMASHDLRPGDYHHSRIDEAIHLHEKTLLLLSEHAINSSWVKHEVQVALAREIGQDCTVLFPLRLDEAVMQTRKDWAVRLRATRHISNFTGWQDDVAYQQAFRTLLQHLKVVKPSPH
jgi:hypothetical protein